MTTRTSRRNRPIILAALALAVLLAAAVLAAILLLTTNGDESGPAATPPDAAAPQPAPAAPRTGVTEVGLLPQTAPPDDVVLWREDGLDQLERHALHSLEVIQVANSAAAQALSDLPWLADELLLDERLTLASVEALAQADPSLAGRVADLPWLADRVDESELQTLLRLNGIARQDAATAQALVEFPWVADGITGPEQQTLETIERLAATDAATAQALAGSSWVADGVSEEEREGLAIVQAVAGSEPEQARELVSLADAAGGISPEQAAVLSDINRDILAFIDTRIEPDFPALAATIRAYPWYRDRTPHATPYHVYTLEAIASSDPGLAQRVAQWPWVARPRLNREQAEVLSAISGLAKRREVVVGEVEIAPGLTVPQTETVEAETPELALRFAQWPWVVEGALPATLQHVVRDLVAIHSEDRRLGLEVAETLSLADGIDPEEAAALRWLGDFLEYTDLSWVRSVLALPWVADGVTTPATAGHAWTDQRGLNWLLKLAAHDRSQGELLLNAPWFRDGLTPEDHALIEALAGTCALRVPYLELIREGQVRSRVLSTPSGDVTYFVVKRASLGPIGDEAMAAMENIITASEDFMEHPWAEFHPNVILSVEPDFSFLTDPGGLNVGSYALVRRDPPQGSKRTLYHEVAHFYTEKGPYWLKEGGANLLESYTFHFTGEATMEARYDQARGLVAQFCAPRGQGTIHRRMLATVDWSYSQWLQSRGCDYYLGEHFLAALYLELGRETVAAALRDLWFSPQDWAPYLPSWTTERRLEHNEELIYQVFLANTPPERQEEFRLLYHCLHGRPVAGYTPSEPCPVESPPPAVLEEPVPPVVVAQGPAPTTPVSAEPGAAGPESALPTQPVVIAQEPTPTAPVSAEPTQPALEPTPSGSEVAASDREVLTALFHDRNGLNWKNNENWLSDRPLSEWSGVRTSLDGTVVSLVLRENGLSGPIPPELGNLRHLQTLWLNNNNLQGPIPPELGNLTELTSLDLSFNRLQGPIPPELGNLSKLESLSLSHNHLHGPIPPELGNLPLSGTLFLYNNHLTGPIPVEMANFYSVDARRNHITGCIPGILPHLSGGPKVQIATQWPLPHCEAIPGGSRSEERVQRSLRDTPPEQREALVSFYHATGGERWVPALNTFLGYDSGWMTERPVREWYGVEVEPRGNVIGLSLYNVGLEGSLPPELSNLRLRHLDLAGNQLTGCVPSTRANTFILGDQDLPPC